MARSSEQKIKLLILYDILLKETDEEHALSTEELVTRLRESGVSVERKALISDIATLNEWGFEVMSYKKRSHYFYVAYRKFETAELRILIDAVQAASFISEKRTMQLTDKIASLAGKHKAAQLKKNMVCYNTVKHNNSHVYYSIDAIERAIEEGRQVSFYYYDYMADGGKAYRKDKRRYIVNPILPIFDRNNYYLLCYNDKYMNLSGYRIDKMEGLIVEERAITPHEDFKNFNPHEYRKEVFSMYAGSLTRIELEADNEAADEIADKFGENFRIVYRDESSFRISAEIRVSPPFFSWITMFEGKIRIVSPESVKQKMREFVLHTYTT